MKSQTFMMTYKCHLSYSMRVLSKMGRKILFLYDKDFRAGALLGTEWAWEQILYHGRLFLQRPQQGMCKPSFVNFLLTRCMKFGESGCCNPLSVSWYICVLLLIFGWYLHWEAIEYHFHSSLPCWQANILSKNGSLLIDFEEFQNWAHCCYMIPSQLKQ